MSEANRDVAVGDVTEEETVGTDDTASVEVTAPETAAPLLRIVGGNPSDEDIAVLVAILGGASGGGDAGPPPDRDLWGTAADRLRPAWPVSPTAFPNLRFSY